MAKRPTEPKVTFQVTGEERAKAEAFCEALWNAQTWLPREFSPLWRAAFFLGVAKIEEDPSLLQKFFRAETRGRKKSKKRN